MSETNIPGIEFPTISVARVVQAPIDNTLTVSGMAADAKATGDAIAAAKAELDEDISEVSASLAAVRGILFPVGSIYVSTSSTAPTFGGANWNWQEIMIPATWGDIQNGARSYSAVGSGDTPGTLHFWLRITDSEVSS